MDIQPICIERDSKRVSYWFEMIWNSSKIDSPGTSLAKSRNHLSEKHYDVLIQLDACRDKCK